MLVATNGDFWLTQHYTLVIIRTVPLSFRAAAGSCHLSKESVREICDYNSKQKEEKWSGRADWSDWQTHWTGGQTRQIESLSADPDTQRVLFRKSGKDLLMS